MYKYLFLIILLPTSLKAETLCHGERFQPCICYNTVPKIIKYRASDPQCPRSKYRADAANHVASVRLSKALFNSFSVVVRDGENNDRSPYEPKLCSMSEYILGLNKCSRWKAQKIFKSNKERVYCFGASGFSKVFRKIVRITIKVSNVPDPKTGEKELKRVCLQSPTKDIN